MGLLTQKNDDFSTISVTEQGCTKQISKVESHLSDRFSYGVLNRILWFVTKWPQALKFLGYLNQRMVNWIIYCSMYCSHTLDNNNWKYFKQTHSPAQSRKKFDCLFTTKVSLLIILLQFFALRDQGLFECVISLKSQWIPQWRSLVRTLFTLYQIAFPVSTKSYSVNTALERPNDKIIRTKKNTTA